MIKAVLTIENEDFDAHTPTDRWENRDKTMVERNHISNKLPLGLKNIYLEHQYLVWFVELTLLCL